MHSCDLAIVGGGSAGIAAARVARNHDLEVWLLDEQPRLGGQIYRQPPQEFKVRDWLAGTQYEAAKSAIRTAEQLPGLKHIGSATVWGCFARPMGSDGGRRYEVLFEKAGSLGRIDARHVILACGCYEAPVPFPGWHLPGVMSAGGIQTLLKSQRIAAGHTVFLTGSHPLLLVVAEQLIAAGIRIAGIAFEQSRASAWRMMRSPSTLLVARAQLLRTFRNLIELRRAGIPVWFGHAVIKASGSRELDSVQLRDLRRGKEWTIDCDALGVCFGFLPQTELSRQVGARHVWAAEGGWVAVHDAYLRTSIAGISVAGELAGVAGAEAAALSGEIAGLGVVRDIGRVPPSQVDNRARELRRRWTRHRRFAAMMAELSAPSAALLSDLARREALICRCEDVTVGELEDALQQDPHIASASTAKLMTRVGMGFCQGRMCETSVRRTIARRRGCPLENVPPYVVRPPVKPVSIATLASVPGALDIDPGLVAAAAAGDEQVSSAAQGV